MVPLLQAAGPDGPPLPFGTAKTAKHKRGEDSSLQFQLQMHDVSGHLVRGGVAVLNKNIGAPIRTPGRK